MDCSATATFSINEDEIADLCISTYLGLPKSFHPAPRSNGVPQYSILAGLVLSKAGCLKCITVATGSKCLPESKLRVDGQSLHDSHAEVLARRGLVRWMYEEIMRYTKQGSDWIEQYDTGKSEGQRFRLKETVKVYMYISTLPCGDASTLALSLSQDPEMAQLKDQSSRSGIPPQSSVLNARGRDNYSLHGVLRTKPGRADSGPTLSMSCSDKIALWTLVGMQGALLSSMMDPVYVDHLVIGEVEPSSRDAMRAECDRAFKTRLTTCTESVRPFMPHPPTIRFTSVAFPYARSQFLQLGNETGAGMMASVAASESVSWVADSGGAEAIVGGFKRGATAKSIQAGKAGSSLSKAAMYSLHCRARDEVGCPQSSAAMTYFDAKRAASEYTRAKQRLRSVFGGLQGWVVSGEKYEAFEVGV